MPCGRSSSARWGDGSASRHPRRTVRGPGTLGTSRGRVSAVDAAATPRVGLKSFPQTLPLDDHEVVLTFDDGPSPPRTTKVLDALKHECVRATFFMVGEMAAGRSRSRAAWALARKTPSSLPFLQSPTADPEEARPDAAMAEIDRGIAAVDTALYGARPRMRPKRRFSGFRDLHPRRPCSTVLRHVGSSCSARTFGPATGTA